jgi:TonB family protein
MRTLPLKLRLTSVVLGMFPALGLAQQAAVARPPIVVTEADYSQEARIAELEGTVSIASTIGDDGHPHNLRIVEPLGLGLDERAMETATQQSFDASAVGQPATIEVRYHLPSKYSRWHLLHAEFEPPEGVSRPEFLSAHYPTGAGILSRSAIEEGRVLGAIGREGTAAITFTIDERGVPTRFQIANASEEMWGHEAIALLREWRFKPGTKDAKPVPVPAKFELAWGPLELNPQRIAVLRTVLERERETATEPGPQSKPVPSKFPVIEILHQVQPYYSQEAMDAKLEGVVVISLITREDGTVGDLQVIQGLGKGLDEKALGAAGQWRFKPFYVNGQFSRSQVMLRFYFMLRPNRASVAP